MTHFPVAVILPAGTGMDDVDQVLTEVLAPYDEQGEWFAQGSKWDWWVIGGRWRGELLTTNHSGIEGESGVYDNPPTNPGGVDVARLGDIDWEGMYAARREVVKGWYQEIKAEGDRFNDLNGLDEEGYLKAHAPFRPQAILMDGEWREAGEMGWFGVGGDKRNDEEWLKIWEETIAKTDKDRILAIVDCHV